LATVRYATQHASAQHGSLQFLEPLELFIARRRTVRLTGKPHRAERRRHFFSQVLHGALPGALEPGELRLRCCDAHELQRRLHSDLRAAERRGDEPQRLEPQRERAPRQQRRARQSEPLAGVLRFRRVAEPPPAVGAMKAPEQARQLELMPGQRRRQPPHFAI